MSSEKKAASVTKIEGKLLENVNQLRVTLVSEPIELRWLDSFVFEVVDFVKAPSGMYVAARPGELASAEDRLRSVVDEARLARTARVSKAPTRRHQRWWHLPHPRAPGRPTI